MKLEKNMKEFDLQGNEYISLDKLLKILRMVGGNDDDLKILIAKRFVLIFETGVIVIKHWRINNLVRKDWYKETSYLEEKNQLKIKENGAYTELVNENTPKLTHRLG